MSNNDMKFLKFTFYLQSDRPTSNCTNFLYYNEEVYKNTLWHGHNGLRDRFARIQRAADMRRMVHFGITKMRHTD